MLLTVNERIKFDQIWDSMTAMQYDRPKRFLRPRKEWIMLNSEVVLHYQDEQMGVTNGLADNL